MANCWPTYPDLDQGVFLCQRRRILVEFLIDEWGEESFPASDPPGGLPPSLAYPTKR